jgi:hypothetical protein
MHGERQQASYEGYNDSLPEDRLGEGSHQQSDQEMPDHYCQHTWWIWWICYIFKIAHGDPVDYRSLPLANTKGLARPTPRLCWEADAFGVVEPARRSGLPPSQAPGPESGCPQSIGGRW